METKAVGAQDVLPKASPGLQGLLAPMTDQILALYIIGSSRTKILH